MTLGVCWSSYIYKLGLSPNLVCFQPLFFRKKIFFFIFSLSLCGIPVTQVLILSSKFPEALFFFFSIRVCNFSWFIFNFTSTFVLCWRANLKLLFWVVYRFRMSMFHLYSFHFSTKICYLKCIFLYLIKPSHCCCKVILIWEFQYLGHLEIISTDCLFPLRTTFFLFSVFCIT